MVYLDVYNTIFRHLETTGLLGDIFAYFEGMLKNVLPDPKSDFYDEFILEFALFNYWHGNDRLIEFLRENLYKTLDEKEKREFDLVLNSERRNLKFEKKVDTGQHEQNGKELYDFYYEDLFSRETKIVRSSSPLEKNPPVINGRLIENPFCSERYSITGAILPKKTFEGVTSLFTIRRAAEVHQKAEAMAEHLLKFSREHSLEEIGRYENQESTFIRQDRKIMKINRLFFEKFGCGFDDFLREFYALSNKQDSFIEMAEYYLAIEDGLYDAIMDTNYVFELPLLLEGDAIKGFVAFLKNDAQQTEECIHELQKEGKRDFKIDCDNEIASTREKVLENQKRFMRKYVAPSRPEGFDSFMARLDAYSPDQLKPFLEELIQYMDKHKQKLGADAFISLIVLNGFLDKEAEMPCLMEVREKQSHYKYDPERFYDYLDVGDAGYSMHVFLAAAHLFQKNEFRKAYRLIKEKTPEKTDSFAYMFLLGRIFSLFEDEGYKQYFNRAKKIDGARYKAELQKFLEEKQRMAIGNR